GRYPGGHRRPAPRDAACPGPWRRTRELERRDMADPRVDVTRADAVLIGGGVASATLAALLSEHEPSWTIEVLEELDDLGQESSEGWNNAATRHSPLYKRNHKHQG